jgi:Ser/Thr protein kinase RdoA (MazF antagonist)
MIGLNRLKQPMLKTVLEAFGFTDNVTLIPFGTGLINHTWKIESPAGSFILQRINTNVFRDPWAISHNLSHIANYLKEHNPGYLFITPIATTDGKPLYLHLASGGCFRVIPFVPNSHTIDVVTKPEQAFEAAHQFGKFTKVLRGVSTDELKITLPSFHDLELRYQQFKEALLKGNADRIKQSSDYINQVESNAVIVTTYKNFIESPLARKRVTHHDTKISNVLLDEDDTGICVIDLDTVMPGYFISDVGDMMRTYLSPVSEEESDYSKIEIREDYFKAIAEGYLSEMRDELSEFELKHFVFSGLFMTYMQAMRFLTDYINDDVYYGSKYEGHNYVRAGNQLVLLEKMKSLSNIQL